MSDNRSNEVRVEGTQFYRRSRLADVLRIVIVTLVVFIAVMVLAAWAIIDAGARQAYKEARDDGLIAGAADRIERISTRSGTVILYSWDDETNAPLQFEYRQGLYRVIYTDTGVANGYSAGVEGVFNVYYSFEILHFEAD